VKMRSEIVSLHRRLTSTIVYVTHDQVEAMTMADRIVVLRDGVTEQVGTPIELYARPQNRFVAGFLGAPQMNMLAGVIRAAGPAGLRIDVDHGRSLVPASVAAGDGRAGETCTIGIRPEHLLPSDDGHLRATVDTIEMVGADTLIYASLQSGERIIASLRGIHPVREGSPLAFTVDQRFVHVFGTNDKTLPPLRPWKEDYVTRLPTAPRSEREDLTLRVG
jgi:multiple sugar transport system ATP-binding protein